MSGLVELQDDVTRREKRPSALVPPRRHVLGAAAIALRSVFVVLGLAIVVQSLIVVQARPQDLVTGFHGMVDMIERASPPDFSKFPDEIWPTLETLDIAIFGTIGGIVLALPLSVLAAANVSPARWLYYIARGLIGFARAVIKGQGRPNTSPGASCYSNRRGGASTKCCCCLSCERRLAGNSSDYQRSRG